MTNRDRDHRYDPSGDAGESSRGGRRNERLESEEYPESPDREEPRSCARCGTEIGEGPLGNRQYCNYCRQKGATDNHVADDTAIESLEHWSIDRVIVAIVDEPSYIAEPTAKGSLKNALDDHGVRESVRVLPASKFDDEPPRPLGSTFETLPNRVPLTEADAQALLADLREQDTDDEPLLFNQYSRALDIECTREAIHDHFGTPHNTLYLCPGVVLKVERTLPEELSTDDDGKHPHADLPSRHERAMENYHDEHGHFPFEEPGDANDQTAAE